MTATFPRESIEFLPATVTVDGVPVTTGVTFCVTSGTDRPVTFVAAVTLSGKIGIMVTGYPVGTYKVWAKYASAPETPVVYCGTFRIT